MPGRGTEEMSWNAKDNGMSRSAPGIYLSWSLGLRPVAGEYQVHATVKGEPSKVFTLKAINAVTGKSFWSKGVRVRNELTEMDFGVFVYDGQFPLLISDWNNPGFLLTQVRLTLVKAMEVNEAPHVSCDSTDRWQCLGDTLISLSQSDRKQGVAALEVRVKPRKDRKWYNAGVMYPVSVKKAGMVSFWIKFTEDPSPFWVQIFAGGKGGVAQKVIPEAHSMTRNEWTYVELPVSTFPYKPQRSVVEDVRALQFSPSAGIEKDVTFLIDDIMLEP